MADAHDDPTPQPTRGVRTGGRSARVVHAVLEATLDELAAHGYAGLSVEAVAARAGVAKTTIYRRWPTKAELLAAALQQARGPASEPIDTGALRSDLVAALRAHLERVSTPRGRAVARAILGGIDDPEVAAVTGALRERQPVVPKVVLERAFARGELPRGTEHAWLSLLLLAPLQARAIFRGETIDARWLGRLVDVVVRGLGGGAAAISETAAKPKRPAASGRGARGSRR